MGAAKTITLIRVDGRYLLILWYFVISLNTNIDKYLMDVL
jgi:hypothetical protein